MFKYRLLAVILSLTNAVSLSHNIHHKVVSRSLIKVYMSDQSFYDDVIQSVDKSVLGLLKPAFNSLMTSVIKEENIANKLSQISSAFEQAKVEFIQTFDSNFLKTVSHSSFKLEVPIKFPALEQNLQDFKSYMQLNPLPTSFNTDEGNVIVKYLDISSYSIIPSSIRDILHQQPVMLRIGLGVLLLEIIPFILDLILIKLIWNKMIDIDISKVDITDLPKTYKKELISSYYRRSPGLVISRLFDILYKGKDFTLGLIQDNIKGEFDATRPLRALQLRELITELGPAFIKVGQALSVRPDLLEPEYLEELGKLQDQVPPFNSSDALEIIKMELGMDPNLVFESLSSFEKPIAAASLGQVYQAKLKNGSEVAVKVQRPNMLLVVTRDLFITRTLFELGTFIPDISEECAGFINVIDNWAGRFVDELDYITEASNSERFRLQMADKTTTLGDAIVVPVVFREYSSGKVLVIEWIEGTKLSSIDTKKEEGKATVRKLTRVLLNSYLVQLLETGFLHADPHPGNFKVTSEGKLCILDYGLMTEVEEDRRFGLLEYVSHLLAKDYSATLDDLMVLGFIPREITENADKRAIVAPLLGSILEQLSAGGGAKAVNLDQVRQEIDGLSEQYPIIIPGYFGLVLRAFGALEGLGLSVDDRYSIVQECFPYLARRLLSDDSPRIRKALKTFLYGQENRLDVRRVDDLAAGYRTFTQTAADAASGKAFQELKYLPKKTMASTMPVMSGAVSASEEETDPTLSAAVRILFSAQGNYVQELILEEAVRIADALSRSLSVTAVRTFRNIGSSGDTSSSPLTSRPLVFPILNPFQSISSIFEEIERRFGISDEDIASLQTLKRLLQILANVERPDLPNKISRGILDSDDFNLVRQALSRITSLNTMVGSDEGNGDGRRSSPAEFRNQIRSLGPLLRDVAPGLGSLGWRFGRRLAGRSLSRLAEEIYAEGGGVVKDTANKTR